MWSTLKLAPHYKLHSLLIDNQICHLPCPSVSSVTVPLHAGNLQKRNTKKGAQWRDISAKTREENKEETHRWKFIISRRKSELSEILRNLINLRLNSLTAKITRRHSNVCHQVTILYLVNASCLMVQRLLWYVWHPTFQCTILIHCSSVNWTVGSSG